MSKSSTTQQARDNSQLFQISTVNIGITPEELKSIIRQENELLLSNSKIIATREAQKRLDNYTETLIPKLVRSELLTAFSEPAIQVLFKKSENTAICTDRKADYEMLSELLIHRINNKSDYTTSVAIEKAITEVNNISIEALMVLTLLFSVTRYVPESGKIRLGLKEIDNLYSKILNQFNLPNDNRWKENLELVNAIKTFNIGNSKKLENFLYESYEGYSSLGLKKASEQYSEAIEKLTLVGLPKNILVSNEINEEYVRLEIFDKKAISKLSIIINDNGISSIVPLNSAQIAVLEDIYDSYVIKQYNATEEFINLISEFPNIKKILEWWDKNIVDFSFEITAIGEVLACTNAIRIDNTLPNIINKE